jgi:O-antigen/teichoic acid export membrane protein
VSSILTKLKARFTQRGFARSVSIIAGGTALGQLIVILASPILTRLYAPDDFGVLAVYASILGMIAVVASLRYEFAIPLAEDDETAANLLVLSLGVVVLISILTGLSVWLGGQQLLSWINAQAIQPYLWLLPIGVLMVGTYQALRYWSIRKKTFGRIARTKFNQGLGNVVTQLGLGLLQFGAAGLLIGQVVGQAAGIGTLATAAYKENLQSFRAVTWSGVKHASLRYKGFPLYMTPASLVNQGGLAVPVLLIAAFYGHEVAGFFDLTNRVLAIPITLIGQSVTQVFLGEAATLVKNDLEKLHHLSKTITRKMLLIAVLPVLLLMAGGGYIFRVVFGEAWVTSGIFAQIMIVSLLLKFSVDSVIDFSILQRQDLSFIWALGRFILVSGGILVANMFHLSAIAAIMIYTVTMTVSYLAKYFIWHGVLSKAISRNKRARDERPL